MCFESRNYLLVLSYVEDWVLPILEHLVKLRWKNLPFFYPQNGREQDEKGRCHI